MFTQQGACESGERGEFYQERGVFRPFCVDSLFTPARYFRQQLLRLARGAQYVSAQTVGPHVLYIHSTHTR